MCDVLDKVENKGKAEGKIEGKNQMALLVKKLLDQSRIEDVKRASEDETYRDKPMKELGILVFSFFVFGMFLLLVQLFQIFNCQLWSHGVEHQIIGVHGLCRSLRINFLA